MVGTQLADGMKVLLVDDVMTAGTAVREVIPKLKAEANVEVIGLVLSVDRMEKTKDSDTSAVKAVEAEFGFPVFAIANVKEIFDKTHELSQLPDCMIFNQFEEMGNHLWHYQVTGSAVAEVFEAVKRPGDRFAGACFTSGSAGTIGCGDYLKEVYPTLKLAVGEALQCPTILENGFGDHRIEGIGDKHIPWIHNVKNTDLVIDIDDEDSQRLLRLFNDPAGLDYLRTCGVGRFRRSSGDILWVGVQAAPGLTEAQWQLSHALAGAGFPLEERAYRPHLTLARRAILPRSMDEGRLSGLLTPLELTLDRLTLMCSERRSGLLRYTPIYEKRLF